MPNYGYIPAITVFIGLIFYTIRKLNQVQMFVASQIDAANNIYIAE